MYDILLDISYTFWRHKKGSLPVPFFIHDQITMPVYLANNSLFINLYVITECLVPSYLWLPS